MPAVYRRPVFVFGHVPNMTQLKATPDVFRAFCDGKHCTLDVRTGAGKTAVVIAAGVAALQWLPAGGRLVLSSRTWLQVIRFYETMRRLHPDIDTILLGSRENLCLDSRVKRAGQAAGDACHDKCMNNGCQFEKRAADLSSVVQAANSGSTPVGDMEDMLALARRRDNRCCPYYGGGLAVQSAQRAQRICVICATTTMVLNDSIAAAHNLKFGAQDSRAVRGGFPAALCSSLSVVVVALYADGVHLESAPVTSSLTS